MDSSPQNDALAGAARRNARRDQGALSARGVWFLAWPAILTFGLESLVGLVDTLMVGRLGAASLAGVGLGAQILHASHVVVIAVGSGTLALVARHVGARRRGEAEGVLVQSLYSALALGLGVAVPVWIFAEPIVALFGVDAAVVGEGAAYVRFIMVGVPLAAMFEIFAAAYRGAGDMRTPLLLGAIVNACNVAGNYVLIFGHFGFPRMGVRGCGLSSSAAFAVGLLLAFAFMRRRDAALRLRGAALRPDLEVARRMLRIGLPAATEQLFLQVGFFFYLVTAAHYGTKAMAAYFIGVRILGLCFLPGLGFGAAAGTIVGQSLGAGEPETARQSGWHAVRLAVTFMSLGGCIIFAAAALIARAFVADAEVIADAVPFIRTLAVAQPLLALDFTLGGALRGAGDTRFPLYTLLLGFYGARLGLAFAGTFVFDLGLTWVWLTLLADYVVRGSLKAWRFRGGAWQSASV